ncbi:DNA-binding response regulator [Paenibacillus sp. J31TS4]|uniref:response regulator n=1 Tax=Paenibacillus sp. J31TS4 TaxID=2807195 RepID=UPI001B093E74|nr:response regulator transcription factor [Paenibacillus sp. J31TS4]GIP38400.1 DNA-binding response regulator [Paenibacillus sp. J31TS4]
MTIRLLLVDDHAVVRRGLQLFLATQPDLTVAGEAAGGAEAIEKAAALRPDVVLMDLQMPGMDGIEATRLLKERLPEAKVIVLTSFSDQEHALPAIRAGARGYLLKDVEPEELVRAIRRVNQGQVELHPEVAGQLVNLFSNSPAGDAADVPDRPAEELTRREREVLRLIATGCSNKEIGAELGITEKTVKTHVSHLLDKLGLADRTQAAIFAVKHGLDA